jgi:acetyl esterase/lipase
MRFLTIGLIFSCSLLSNATELPLWENDAIPFFDTSVGSEHALPDRGDHIIRLTDIRVPSVSFYPAPQANRENQVPLVVVCPGGGYKILAYDLEGTEVVEWLNSIGISALLLKYRVPNNRDGALADLQQAIQLARKNSKDWNIDPEQVGALGFSAGGHLVARCSNSSVRPDFSVLVYPAYLFKSDGKLVDEIQVSSNTPPAFIVQAQDDFKYYKSSLAYAAALDAQHIPVSLHLFSKGGHGFGLRSKQPVSCWPTLCKDWMSALKK